MNGEYWLVRTGATPSGFGCVFAPTGDEALADAARSYGGDARDPLEVPMEWFHYAPLVAKPLAVGGRETASLREQFYSGGRIGCEALGLEIMFTPDLYPEPREEGDGDDATTVYGNALIRVKGRPDLDASIVLEGLDDAHLVDRLSSEAVIIVGKARQKAA